MICSKCNQEWIMIHDCPQGGTYFHLEKPTPESIMMNQLNTDGYGLYWTPEGKQIDLTRKSQEELYLRHLVTTLFRYFEAKVREQCLAKMETLETLN